MLQLVNLTMLDLSYNQLSGVLPHHFGKFSKLKLMVLDFINLEGFLPPSLTNCTNLVELRLADNFFAGEITRINFSYFSQLSKLDLRKNNFTGIFPISLYSCKSLKAIRLSCNNLEGEIQPEILSLKSLSFLSLGDNTLTNVTGAMKILMRFTTIYVGNNNTINGNIPTEISQLQLLHTLSLSNNFSRNIPEQMANLKNLEILDLSMNHLSGKIHLSLASLNFLSSFNVSYNNLEGQIPTSTQLQSFNASAFEGNPKLCGAPLSNECLPNPKKGNEEYNNKNNNHDHLDINGQQIPWLSVVFGFIVGFLGVCGPICIFPISRKLMYTVGSV
ncbi:tyrosine-sulfated glycopeptide receptor 1-like [Rosa rugosa]|uniref:tyrosine-sulfated glycopeptide receptor 1-like n=1 Tax=Rosa rugosa TaxID=74645 RepID=UPI002B412737|nr:tyrosine-sulfated glycopeptide receptor 1-like [Rosa rugosa]